MEEHNSILDKIISSKQITEIEHFNPAELVTNLLKHLISREEDVLRRRFGLTEKKKETLEEIGKSYGVTRERVRQIESTAITKIKKLKNFKELISPIENTIASVLEQHGGIMQEDSLLKSLLHISGDSNLNRQCVLFILSQLLTNKFKNVKSSKEFRTSWHVNFASISFLQQVIEQLLTIIREKNYPLKTDELIDGLQKTKFFEEHKNQLTPEIIVSYLETSKKIAKNPFNEYGLSEWGSIIPKRMNDKIYLVLKKHSKPLHFTEITRRINEINFDKKKAHPPTVHNELILNNKYVLVGRGIYALREWGYEPGVVADVLVNILKKASKPMTRQELVEEILKQRIVKKNTIHLALTDKGKFKKLDEGHYTLVNP